MVTILMFFSFPNKSPSTLDKNGNIHSYLESMKDSIWANLDYSQNVSHFGLKCISIKVQKKVYAIDS